ncbi:MAG: class 1 fructose-bisphosphatase [Planctomycetota bacterium]|nr:class 1 fructose-bisphosphatase [Planctomycetota bacterium]
MVTQFEEGITLDRFIFETTRDHPEATGRFATLLQQIALAARLISARVNRAGLAGMLGGTGEVNVQGEFVQKLDEYSNEVLKRALEHPGVCCMLASEEDEEPFIVPDRFATGPYAVCVDPLDGSSNIDVNATIGTIFGVFKRKSSTDVQGQVEDLLQPGTDLIGAGYVIYGSGTVFVLSTGNGVHGFTLDPTVGEFFLSHPNLRLAPRGTIFSVNEAYASQWPEGIRDYVRTLKEPDAGMSARYIGSLVADFHRNLIKGGIFLYPGTAAKPKGKLRLLFEGFPLAFLAEAAGGAATDGRGRLLERVPESIHERTPLIIGNRDDVADATRALSPEYVAS